jgi:hypothetical protein
MPSNLLHTDSTVWRCVDIDVAVVTSFNILKINGNFYDRKNMFHVTRFFVPLNFFFNHYLVAGIYLVSSCHDVSRKLALHLWMRRTVNAPGINIERAKTP